jgi:iron(III) transport system substrate-binding protein
MFGLPKIRRKLATVAFAATALLILNACASPLQAENNAGNNTAGNDQKNAATEVYEKFASMAEPQRTEELVKAAKAEGGLALVGSSSLQDYADAFERKYGIKGTLYESDTDTAVARLTQEAAAGKYNSDVIDGGSTFLNELQSKGLLGLYKSQYRDQMPASAQGEFWTANRIQPFVVGYNTDKVKESDLPDDYLGFGDPKWKGQISVEQGDYDWYQGVVQYYLAQGMTQDDIDTKLRAVAANARTTDGHSDQAQLLAAGQFAVTLSSYVHHILGLKDDGAPVNWTAKVQPVITRYEGVALLAHAPHPATATLFMDFMLSPDGMAILKKEDYLPSNVAEGSPMYGVKTTDLDLEEYAKNSAKWSDGYDKLLRDTH